LRCKGFPKPDIYKLPAGPFIGKENVSRNACGSFSAAKDMALN
jgi:hypothetical protein